MRQILQCKSLVAGYQKKAVVSDVNFEVNSGEIVTIIGVNGAGKSTLLKTVAGLLPIVSGNVYLAGQEVTKLSSKEKARKVSVLLTDKLQSEYMTCYDVVATGRYAYTNGLGMLSAEDKSAIEEAMNEVDLRAIKEQQFDQLSDGQKQRVMLARAICQNPELIILDEPTSFLDIGYKLEIMSMLKKMAEKDIAILMTMHDLELAKKVSDRVVSIKEGKIDCIGTPEKLLSDEYLCKLFGVEPEKYREFYQ